MKYTHFLVLLLLWSGYTAQAQTKYGIVIGINKYFKTLNGTTVPDPDNSNLKGCVNDAKSIKQLLVSRFGFPANNIREIYNEQATENNIRKEIKDLLQKCKKGDIVAFYYSGHGFSFPHIDPETGTQWAEAICTSDMLVGPPYHFIESEELANLFGSFVDKGVVLTSIFDCCHSNGTVRLKKSDYKLTGLRQMLDMSAWRQEKEPNWDFSHNAFLADIDPVPMNSWITQRARDTLIACNGQNIDTLFKSWLDMHAGARLKVPGDCTGDVVWAYKEIKTMRRDNCELFRKRIEFSVTFPCQRTETTSANFVVYDNDNPQLIQPAKDTTIVCCGQDYKKAFNEWLENHGGSVVTDACSVNWLNDCTDEKRADLDAMGRITINFFAEDICHDQLSTNATFMVEDQSAADNTRLSDLETNLVLQFLNKYPEIAYKLPSPELKASGMAIGSRFFKDQQTVNNIETQMSIISELRKNLLTGDKVTSEKLESLQGTPQMRKLAKAIDSLLVLVDPMMREHMLITLDPYKPAVSKPPLDFLIPVSDTLDYSDFLRSGGKDLAKEAALVTADPAKFPYLPFPNRPPSKIPGSMFLFMSATDDIQKGVEKKDESKQSHGAFTKALISVLRDNPATLNSVELFEKVKKQLADRYIPHTPSMSISVNRRTNNLFGVNDKTVADKFSARCIKVNRDNTIVLDKGLLSGLAAGNVLKDTLNGKQIDIEIIKMFGEDNAIAKIKPAMNAVNFSVRVLSANTSLLNDKFFIVDNYAASEPLVKVYIPKKIPKAEVTDILYKKCMKDQNLKLVEDSTISHLSFYSNYSDSLKSDIYTVTIWQKAGTNKKPGFIPYYYFPAINQQTQKQLNPAQIADNIYNTLLLFASKYGWINKSPRK